MPDYAKLIGGPHGLSTQPVIPAKAGIHAFTEKPDIHLRERDEPEKTFQISCKHTRRICDNPSEHL